MSKKSIYYKIINLIFKFYDHIAIFLIAMFLNIVSLIHTDEKTHIDFEI